MNIGECDCRQARHQHGTYLMHEKHHCFCDPCVRANRRARKMRERGYQRLVDAEPVRRHIGKLFEGGMTYATVGKQAGVTSRTIVAIYCENQQTTQRSTAEAILAVKPAPHPNATVAKVGTMRRIRALQTLGWNTDQMAPYAGCSARTLEMATRDQRESVSIRVAEGVRAAYEQLWDKRPPADTVQQRRCIARLQTLAKRGGWAPPLAWDDDTIDDPEAEPQGVGLDRYGTPATVEAAWRIELGESVAVVARDLGVKPESLERRKRVA